MFFDNASDIPRLARSSQTTIFAINPDTAIDVSHAIEITPPDNKQGITIEQIREVIEISKSKQSNEQFIIIRHAETLGQNAANALLKLLEEPSANYHYVLLTLEPHSLLPTILSRANLFVLQVKDPLNQKPSATPEVIALAKRLLTATPEQLPTLADELAKNKTDARSQAMAVVATAIELAYKSYFATKKSSFLTKIPKLIQLHQNLQSNGLLKLHIVADLC